MTADRAGEVLGMSPRTVQRHWKALMDDGVLRVIAQTARPDRRGANMLRIRVLRGKLDAVTAALARELGFGVPAMPWHAQRDAILELYGGERGFIDRD